MTLACARACRGTVSILPPPRSPNQIIIVKRLLLLFLLNPFVLYADWKVLDRHDSPVSNGKLAASELRVTDGATEAEVNLVYFTAADVTLEVIANTDGQIRGLRELIEERGGQPG